MKRNDTICDCCGKILNRYDFVKLRGKGIRLDWDRSILNQKVDLCNECWIKILEYIDHEKRIKEV